MRRRTGGATCKAYACNCHNIYVLMNRDKGHIYILIQTGKDSEQTIDRKKRANTYIKGY